MSSVNERRTLVHASRARSPRIPVIHLEPEANALHTHAESFHNTPPQGFTYAALSRGVECFCSDVRGESALLKYMESALCDIPCPGEPRYHCGGAEFMSLYRTSVPGAFTSLTVKMTIAF